MYRDIDADPPVLVCRVGSTTLRCHVPSIEDLYAMLVKGVPLGAADENKPAATGTVEAWGRAEDDPIGEWYGVRNNRVRAL